MERVKLRCIYPATRRSDHVDQYHGTPVPDPYRWLEDHESDEVKAWVEKQNELTESHLRQIPCREQIRTRLKEVWDHEKRSLPARCGERFFWYQNSGLQNHSVLYVANSPNAEDARLLLDPNLFSEDGTVALVTTSMTDDGSLMAYSVSDAGSDYCIWHVRDVASGEDLPDVVGPWKFSNATWTKDNAGFLYNRCSETTGAHGTVLLSQELYYHRLGTDQSQDIPIYERPDHPDWLFNTSFTEDFRFLTLTISSGFDGNRLFIARAQDGVLDYRFQELFADDDAHRYVVGNDEDKLWIFTDEGAPRGRLVCVNFADWKEGTKPEQIEVLPQSGDTMQGVTILDNKFVVSYLYHAHTRISVFNMDGRHLHNVQLPGIGSVYGFHGKRDWTTTYYWFTSFSTPGSGYEYDMRSGESTLFYKPDLKIDPDQFTSQQVFFKSKDGTRIPMFICHKKDLRLDGNNPTYLFGYGGFKASFQPYFSMNLSVWMEMGGVFAVACLRGGGEYGEDWHQAGTRHNKQNVFDDFIAAAKTLIAGGYTSSEKLAIAGSSNGGLLIGACVTQRPDLFAAIVPDVGVLDMLRYHKFTIGSHWMSEYGSAEEDPEMFRTLMKYSPLHNVRPGTKYPATLVTASDHDDRVVPCHSYKFAAALQHAQTGDAPILLRVEKRAGHGMGRPISKLIDRFTDEWAFLMNALKACP